MQSITTTLLSSIHHGLVGTRRSRCLFFFKLTQSPPPPTRMSPHRTQMLRFMTLILLCLSVSLEHYQPSLHDGQCNMFYTSKVVKTVSRHEIHRCFQHLLLEIRHIPHHARIPLSLLQKPIKCIQ